MQRRGVLAAVSTLTTVGCIGRGDGNRSSEPSDTAEHSSDSDNTGFSPNGIVLDHTESVRTDQLLEVEPLRTNYYTESLEYYDEESDEIAEYDPDGVRFLQVDFYYNNIGGEAIDFPGIDGFSTVGDSVTGEILYEPASHFSWDEVREHGMEDIRVANERPIEPGESRGIGFTASAPEGVEFLRWEHDYQIDSESHPVFWELELTELDV